MKLKNTYNKIIKYIDCLLRKSQSKDSLGLESESDVHLKNPSDKQCCRYIYSEGAVSLVPSSCYRFSSTDVKDAVEESSKSPTNKIEFNKEAKVDFHENSEGLDRLEESEHRSNSELIEESIDHIHIEEEKSENFSEYIIDAGLDELSLDNWSEMFAAYKRFLDVYKRHPSVYDSSDLFFWYHVNKRDVMWLDDLKKQQFKSLI